MWWRIIGHFPKTEINNLDADNLRWTSCVAHIGPFQSKYRDTYSPSSPRSLNIKVLPFAIHIQAKTGTHPHTTCCARVPITHLQSRNCMSTISWKENSWLYGVTAFWTFAIDWKLLKYKTSYDNNWGSKNSDERLRNFLLLHIVGIFLSCANVRKVLG